MSKGSSRRPGDDKAYAEGHERIFGGDNVAEVKRRRQAEYVTGLFDTIMTMSDKENGGDLLTRVGKSLEAAICETMSAGRRP